MKRTSVRLPALAATTGMLFGSLGLPATANANPALKIAVILKNDSDPYWVTVFSGAKVAAKELGAKVSVTYGAGASESDVLGQIAKIQDAITTGAKAVVVAPTEPSEDIPVLKKAVAEGVKVILVDTPTAPQWTGYSTFIGTNNFVAGRTGGEALVKVLGGKGTVGIIDGAPGVTSTEQRVAGFRAAIKGTNIKVVADLATNPSCAVAPGTTDAQNLLTAHANISAIWSPCGSAALGAVAVVQAAQDVGKVKVFGFDVELSYGPTAADKAMAVHAFQDGEITASMDQNPALMGKLGVLDAYKILTGGTVPKDVDTGVDVLTKANVKSVLG